MAISYPSSRKRRVGGVWILEKIKKYGLSLIDSQAFFLKILWACEKGNEESKKCFHYHYENTTFDFYKPEYYCISTSKQNENWGKIFGFIIKK